MKRVFVLFFLFFISFSIYGQGWLTSWSKRQSIVITNYNYSPLFDYQVRLEIGQMPGMQPDFDDVRFTDTTSTNLLPYWIEHADTDTAVFWVKIDSIAPFSAGEYYMYFGNPEAESLSNPEETFIFYDDFTVDDGWNSIGSNASTAITSLDSISTINKYQFCGITGSWKSIGDTITNFKLITRDYMPDNSSEDCSLIEYGVESSSNVGFNLRRDAMDTGTDTEFGLEKRNGPYTSSVTTTMVDQPVGDWYYTMVSYCHICQFNLHATIRTSAMDLIGEVYHYDYNTYDLSRLTIRGGYSYHMDYVAIAKNLCIDPQLSFSEVIESCPVGTLVNFADDLCDEGLGEITLDVTGGIPPYNIIWYNGEDSLGMMTLDTVGTAVIDSLSAGEYCFKIIDSEGCEN